MRYSYFPGCSLKGTNIAYEESVLAVFRELGVELEELEDWNCCGATSYMSVDENQAVALAARNLALAEAKGQDLIVPCSGCWLVLQKAKHHIETYPDIRENVQKSFKKAELNYTGKVKIRHPLEVILNDIGLDKIKEKVTKPLTNVKVAPYYGCQIVRPFAIFDDPIYPTAMDQIIVALGADVVKYPLKTRCCGGSLTGTLTEVGSRLVFILLREAKKCKADVIATICPLCHFNLDSYQDEISHERKEDISMPTVYFTQLLGLALGLPAKQLGLQRNIVSAEPALIV